MATSKLASSRAAAAVDAPPLTAARVRRVAVWILAGTAACLPLYVVRWHIGPLPTTLLEVLIFLLVAAYIAVLWTERRLPAARTPYDIAIVLLLIAGIAGIVVAPDHLHALGIYRAYFVEAIVVFYIAVDLLRTREDLHVFLSAAAVGAAVMAIGEIAYFTWVAAHHELQLGDAPAFLNTSPNANALYMEPPLAFAVAFSLFPSLPRERVLAVALLALIFVATLLTLSRASYLAMATLAVVLVLSAQTPRWRLRAVGTLAVLLLAALEVPFINQRFATLANSAANRDEIYRETLQMLSQTPLTGAGLGGFATRLAPFRPPQDPVHIYPHDLWLTAWSEIGLLGLIAFGLIFFGVLWRAARKLHSAQGIARPLLWGCTGAIVLYTVHGLFDTPYWKNDLAVLFWLVVALQVVAARLVGGPQRA